MHDTPALKKLHRLIDQIDRETAVMLRQAEPLKYDLQGFYSLRITKRDRLVFRVSDDSSTIEVIQCRYHYADR